MEELVTDPRDDFIIMLNERIGQLEETSFMLKKEVSDLQKIIYCERMHVYINDEKMYVNGEYHDRIYQAVLSLHEAFVSLMPIKTIYYITNIVKTPQMHLYIIFSRDVPYDHMKQTINTLIIKKLAAVSVKISSIYWQKVTEDNKNEIDGYLDKSHFSYIEKSSL